MIIDPYVINPIFSPLGIENAMKGENLRCIECDRIAFYASVVIVRYFSFFGELYCQIHYISLLDNSKKFVEINGVLNNTYLEFSKSLFMVNQ
jgi:hypothetical protein